MSIENDNVLTDISESRGSDGTLESIDIQNFDIGSILNDFEIISDLKTESSDMLLSESTADVKTIETVGDKETRAIIARVMSCDNVYEVSSASLFPYF